jgi:hypothetical protein
MPLCRRLTRAVEAFFFTPASARPLGALRIGLAAVLIAQAWMIRAQILDFFAQDGIAQGELARYYSVSGAPHLAWLVERLSPLGISEASCIYAVCGGYFLSLLLLFTGFHTRLAAVSAWFLHWTLLNTGHASVYGVDRYAHIFLFYLMCVPAGRAYSLDVALGRVSSASTAAARLGLRVLQIHLCLSYLASGIEKSSGAQWWNGELLWRALSLPVYQQFDMTWLAEWPWLSRVGGWATLAIETGYCVFIWPRRTRKLWILATVALHLGIAIFLGLHVFGATLCVLTVALFGFSPEPRGLSASQVPLTDTEEQRPAPSSSPDPRA